MARSLTRFLVPAFLLLVIGSLTPANAAGTCNLQISLNCTAAGSGQTCVATTVNAGSNTCAGSFYTGFFVEAGDGAATLSDGSNTLGLSTCLEPQTMPGVSSTFSFCFGSAALAPGNSFTSRVTITPGTNAAQLPQLPLLAFTAVEDDASGEELGFAYTFNGIDVPTCTPSVSVAPITQSGVAYDVTWNGVSDPVATFTIDESTSPDFTANLVSSSVAGHAKTFVHAPGANTTYYYRVKANNCGGAPGPYSAAASIVVQAAPPQGAKSVDAVVPFGSTASVDIPLTFRFNVSGKTALDTTFTASSDKPYVTVKPSSGTLPPSGQLTLTATANPASLPPGANTATIKVTTNTGTNLGSLPLSLSLVTPVTPGGKSLPPSNALIIPVVTHVNGAAGPFQSDVRLTNGSGSKVDYKVTFTPTRTDGTQQGKSTTLSVDPQQTIALNDIAKDFFGFGATGDPNDVGFGSLEIRPLNSSSTSSFASSRTYATTAAGTFGQFIAAVPFSSFVGKGVSLPIPGSTGDVLPMSLQQIAQSTRFRTNLGLVEGSGSPANGLIKVFDDAGQLLKSIPYALQAGEHQQLNSFLAANGITNLQDGRIEITVDSETGAVSAYASVLDNVTTDPLAVMPVQPKRIQAQRFVLPGIADLSGNANFHSDVRIFNGGTFPADVTLTYYPQHNPAGAKTLAPIRINPNEVKALDNVLPSAFNLTATGGSIVATTTTPASLVATARTYSIGANDGTFGQFIPGVTPAEGTGIGERPLQILQLEQSQNFRSNLGLTELTGNPARVRIGLNLPDERTTPTIEVDLAGNEFNQLGSVIASMLPGRDVYNARITVEVVSGTGRVTAYGSVIDNATQDPTYVPAQ